jgi:hypothetical protein
MGSYACSSFSNRSRTLTSSAAAMRPNVRRVGDDLPARISDIRPRPRLAPWTHVRVEDAGGPGTGFRAASIVIEDGKTLGDLAARLAALSGSQGSRW